MQHLKTGLFAIAVIAGCSNSRNQHVPDNSARNSDPAIDTNGDHAAQSGDDLALTKKIREAIVGDSHLSTNAHNCKILVDNGVATVIGPVADATEKARVVELAEGAGANRVVDRLEIVDATAKR